MSGHICFRQGRAADLETARTLLAAEGLPVEDLTAQHMADFIIATRDGMTLGMIGLESFGDVALLRSLVVDSGYRGVGLGRKLVAALESAADRNDQPVLPGD